MLWKTRSSLVIIPRKRTTGNHVRCACGAKDSEWPRQCGVTNCIAQLSMVARSEKKWYKSASSRSSSVLYPCGMHREQSSITTCSKIKSCTYMCLIESLRPENIVLSSGVWLHNGCTSPLPTFIFKNTRLLNNAIPQTTLAIQHDLSGIRTLFHICAFENDSSAHLSPSKAELQ